MVYYDEDPDSRSILKHGIPLNSLVAKDSPAEKFYRKSAGLPIDARSLAPGFAATPDHDLINHGGKTIHDLNFENFYIGGADSWNKDDVKSIDFSLAAAMSDSPLNNVMAQYFRDENLTTLFRGSVVLNCTRPKDFFKKDIETLLNRLYTNGMLHGDLENTVFNIMLPRGTILHGNAVTEESLLSTGIVNTTNNKQAKPESPKIEVNSLNGLGGYHGSVHVANGYSQTTLYYAVGVYSEIMKDGNPNGIPVFDQSWKNVVATFYHQLNEARTDSDVEDVIKAGDNSQMLKRLGWTSKQGEECGDFPVFEASPLMAHMVFKEVPLAAGNTKVPVQLQYSNAVHGPEGPIAHPHRHARGG